MTDRVLKRLTVLQAQAATTPVPTRKFFHIGQPELMDDVGECVPMIAWVDDNLSRYVLSDMSSESWGQGAAGMIFTLPNIAVSTGEGVFVATGAGQDESLPHPQGKGRMHFVHLHQPAPMFEKGVTKLYVYRLEGVQVKGLARKS